MPRKKVQQSKHDSMVRKEALEFKKKGYDVAADISGYRKPGIFNGYRPDVVATKDGQKKIVEIETPDSKGTLRDKAQNRAFRNAADRNENMTFRRKITK